MSRQYIIQGPPNLPVMANDKALLQAILVGAFINQTVNNGTATSGQGGQSVDASALLQFVASASTGQGTQTVAATGTMSVSFSGSATTGQGSQSVDASALLTFVASVLSGQGSQSADATALLQFVSAATSGQGSQSVDAAALLQFVADTQSGQGDQSVDAIGDVETSGISGDATTGQGKQTVDAVALLQFIADNVSGQSQTVDVSALLQFLADNISGQGDQSADAAAQLQFFADAQSGQGSQTVDAVGTAFSTSVTGDATSGQGDQTVDAIADGGTQVQALDGAGVGRGNKSWLRDAELVSDHRIRHTGASRSGQSQAAEAVGEVRNPCAVIQLRGRQANQVVLARGDVTDPELELFALAAAHLLLEAA